MTKRNDVHAPSQIDPSDYSFERVVYLVPPMDVIIQGAAFGYIEQFMHQIRLDLEWVKANGWTGGNFAAKRTCDHCGARFHYGMAYRHRPTNDVIVVGWICAGETMDVDDRATLEYNRLVKRVHTMRDRVRTQLGVEKRKADLFELYPDMEKAFETDHGIVRDIKARFEESGFLSEKQIALVMKLHRESMTRKAEPNWVAVVTGRRTVQAKVLAARVEDSMYGMAFKMLIQIGDDTSAEKVWTTIPSALLSAFEKLQPGAPVKALRGHVVEVTLTLEASRNDPKFGIGKRPIGGKILSTPAPAASFEAV